jgi:putative colanic acid biosynthesis UDP-glucose lipid carrier transferase
MSIANSGLVKQHHSSFALIARMLDMAIIFITLWLAIKLSGQTEPLMLRQIFSALLVALILQVAAEFTELYRSWRSESVIREMWVVVKLIVFSFALALITAGMLFPQLLFTWPQLPYWSLLLLIGLCSWRVVAREFLHILRSRGYNTRSVAIVGSGNLAVAVAKRLVDCSWGGYVINGFYDDRQELNVEAISTSDSDRRHQSIADDQGRVKVMGCFDDVVAQAECGKVDHVYIALPMRAELRIIELTARLANSTASIYVIPDIFVFELLQAKTINLNGIPAISIVSEPMTGVDGWLKRIEDIVLSAVILAFIALPMLVIATAVKLTSKGPVFFKQNRYGIDGRSIKVWKFRSMTVCEDGDTVTQATKGDMRITKLGAFLRRTSLDELPQFINVLGGGMSIVGPRPHAIAHNEEYRVQIPGYMMRHKIKPGITGWAQINGWRGETDTLDKMEKRVEFDLHYIRHWSLCWDLKIILKTIFKGFINENAY